MNTVWFRILALFLLGTLVVRAAESRTIVFFGDSLTAGYGLNDPSTEAYPALIQEKLNAEKPGWRAVNAGLSGETTAAGLRRIDWILRQPVDVFVLALGGNDGLRGIDPAVSRSNLQKILERVRTKNPAAKLVVAGMQMPPSMGADFAREFEKMYPEVAKENNATLIPFILDGVGGRLELNQGDRIHPTAQGQVIVASTVWRYLRPLL